MPEVHFIGELVDVRDISLSCLSVTWASVPGNAAWTLRGGEPYGETHTCFQNTSGVFVLNHPIDLQYDSSSSEGWPFIVVELWDRSNKGLRGFTGCGSVWLPASPASHLLEIVIWRPSSHGLEKISESMVPSIPDLRLLRELITNPYTRSQIETETVGTLRLAIQTAVSGFTQHGIRL